MTDPCMRKGGETDTAEGHVKMEAETAAMRLRAREPRIDGSHQSWARVARYLDFNLLAFRMEKIHFRCKPLGLW